jgi:secreted trypsin-like serine protease
MTVFLALILMAIATESHHVDPDSEDRMFRGHDAKPHSAPYYVTMILIPRPFVGFVKPLCGGSILTENWVLSAGHCITTLPYDFERHQKLVIYAGDPVFSEKPTSAVQSRLVARRYKHPKFEWDPEGRNLVKFADLQLIRVNKPFEFNEFVQKITMAPKDYVPSGKVTVFGMGRVGENASPGSLQVS